MSKPSASTTCSGASADRERAWRRLVTLGCIVLAGWAAATAFHHIHATILGHGYPLGTFLFSPSDRYNDLLNSWVQARSPNPFFDRGTPAVATYFPLVYVLLALLRDMSPRTLVTAYVVVTYVSVTLVVVAWLRAHYATWRGDSRWPVVVVFAVLTAQLSYPLIFAVDRGNFDPLLMVTIAASLWLLERDRPYAGAGVLAVAVALKGYPLVVFALWLRRRHLGAAVAGVLLAATLVALPGLAFDGGIPRTLVGLRLGLAAFKEAYVVGDGSAHFSADWINAARLIAHEAGVAPSMSAVVGGYQVVATLLAAALALHAAFVARAGARALLAVVMVMLTFPNVTNDYKLVLLLPVALAWTADPSAGAWRDRTFAAAVGLLLVPKQYAFFSQTDASISCVINPVLITALVAVLWPTADELAHTREVLTTVRSRLRPGVRSSAAEMGDRP